MRRTRQQIDVSGDTPETLRAALDAHDKRKGWPSPDEWMLRRSELVAELALADGRTFPNSIEFDAK